MPDKRVSTVGQFSILVLGEETGADDSIAGKVLQSVFVQVDFLGEIGVTD